jgi:hypothetical protein
MKTSTLIQINPDRAHLFQTAARMTASARVPCNPPALTVTGKNFSDLRMEAERSHSAENHPDRRESGANRRMSISFDTVRMTVFVHTLNRIAAAEGVIRPEFRGEK